MKQKKSNRVTAILLTLIMCLGIFPAGLTASAATTGTMYMVGLPRASDPNQSGWGHSALNLMNGWSLSETNSTTAKALDGYENSTVYCIEPGVHLNVGDTLSEKDEDFWKNYPDNLNQTIEPDDIKKFIGRIFQYGWTGKNNLDWNSTNATHAEEMAELLATQILVWETVVGERDSSFNKIDAAGYAKDNVLESIQSNHPLRSQILTHYNRIVSSVQSHVKLPSFMKRESSLAQTVELTWDGSKYSAVLTDSNNVLGNYSFSSSTSGISFSVSGNQLTISASTAPTGSVSITANKSAARKATVVWTDGVMSSSDNGHRM